MSWFHAITGKVFDEVPAGVWRAEGAEGHEGVIGPALFDPQVNGFVGVDFQSPYITLDELDYAAECLERCGCSHFLITLITADAAELVDQFRRLAELLDQSTKAGKHCLGFHLEGPFISATPGFVGAHPIKHTCDPRWEVFEKFQAASGDRIRIITLDPERHGAFEFIRQATASGVWVSMGHANPSLESLWEGVEAGARLFTHLSNGCPVQLPRHDNIINRVLSVTDLQVLLIPDGIHIPAPALSNLAKAVGPSRLIMTTDAATPAGGPPGRYRFGALDLEVADDRIVRLPGSQNLAGSALTPIQGLYNAIRIGGLGVADAWLAWTRLRRMMFPDLEPPLLALPMPNPAPMFRRKHQRTE